MERAHKQTQNMHTMARPQLTVFATRNIKYSYLAQIYQMIGFVDFAFINLAFLLRQWSIVLAPLQLFFLVFIVAGP